MVLEDGVHLGDLIWVIVAGDSEGVFVKGVDEKEGGFPPGEGGSGCRTRGVRKASSLS